MIGIYTVLYGEDDVSRSTRCPRPWARQVLEAEWWHSRSDTETPKSYRVDINLTLRGNVMEPRSSNSGSDFRQQYHEGNMQSGAAWFNSFGSYQVPPNIDRHGYHHARPGFILHASMFTGGEDMIPEWDDDDDDDWDDDDIDIEDLNPL